MDLESTRILPGWPLAIPGVGPPTTFTPSIVNYDVVHDGRAADGDVFQVDPGGHIPLDRVTDDRVVRRGIVVDTVVAVPVGEVSNNQVIARTRVKFSPLSSLA